MPGTRRQFFATLGAIIGGFGMIGGGAAWAQGDDVDGLNVFISPHGQPFRAPDGAPYPIGKWFAQADANGDGRIDHGEFLADAAAFFKVLDRNGDGVISAQEVAFYERRICPEILGLTFSVSALAPGRARVPARGDARLWLAQFRPDGMDQVPSRQVESGVETPTRPMPLAGDEANLGASPFSLFNEPEPVATADLDFNGKITKANFLRLADMHFTALDPDGTGYLLLKRLPKTTVQKRIEHPHRR